VFFYIFTLDCTCTKIFVHVSQKRNVKNTKFVVTTWVLLSSEPRNAPKPVKYNCARCSEWEGNGKRVSPSPADWGWGGGRLSIRHTDTSDHLEGLGELPQTL